MPAATKLKQFSVSLLAEVIRAKCPNSPSGVFTGVSTDSRAIKPGECFFAIPGGNFDGHDYVVEAFAKGASCTVVNRDIPQSSATGWCILNVADTVKALGDFARWYRLQNDFRVVAITGSVGKTTTRQIAYHVLSRHFRTSQAPRNYNNEIGLPLTLLNAQPDDEVVVAELGTNHPGEIVYLSSLAAPDIAVITNVHLAHLEGFSSLDAILQEKLSISQGLRSDGIMIVNGRFERLANHCRTKGLKFITFGYGDDAIRAMDVVCTALGSSFLIDGVEVQLPLPGPGNVENALAAWAVCSRFGISAADFAQAMTTLPTVPMRLELTQIGTVTVLNDSYNANPASMDNALTALDSLVAERCGEKSRCVFICGDMAELGDQSVALHEQLGRRVAESRVDILVAAGKLAGHTAEAAKAHARRQLHTICFDNAVSLCDSLQELVRDHDVVLVKGSRTARLETVVEKLQEVFSRGSSRQAEYAASDVK